VVLCDRYIYAASRDVVRGMNSMWVRELYNFAVKPTVPFYFHVPLRWRQPITETGSFLMISMDPGLSEDPEEFRLFQARIIEEYEKMMPEFEITVVDATLPIEMQQAQMRQVVKSKLAQAKG
jgi:dTMP kinase